MLSTLDLHHYQLGGKRTDTAGIFGQRHNTLGSMTCQLPEGSKHTYQGLHELAACHRCCQHLHPRLYKPQPSKQSARLFVNCKRGVLLFVQGSIRSKKACQSAKNTRLGTRRENQSLWHLTVRYLLDSIAAACYETQRTFGGSKHALQCCDEQPRQEASGGLSRVCCEWRRCRKDNLLLAQACLRKACNLSSWQIQIRSLAWVSTGTLARADSPAERAQVT